MKYILLLLVSIPLFAQKEMTPQMSEAWEPVPEIINPGDANSPPSDAIVLFDGTDLSQWINAKTGKVADWTINPDGSMTVKQDGGIETKEEFGSIQLHIEWRTPPVIKGKGQGRGNSGVYFQKTYEVQVLDSYNNVTYSNGQAASIYKQSIPLVNASRPPGEWQTYDVTFHRPLFNDEGEVTRKAKFHVIHNGHVIHDNLELSGGTGWRGPHSVSEYKKHGDKGPLKMQDHGNPVRFRNVWVVPIGDKK